MTPPLFVSETFYHVSYSLSRIEMFRYNFVSRYDDVKSLINFSYQGNDIERIEYTVVDEACALLKTTSG